MTLPYHKWTKIAIDTDVNRFIIDANRENSTGNIRLKITDNETGTVSDSVGDVLPVTIKDFSPSIIKDYSNDNLYYVDLISHTPHGTVDLNNHNVISGGVFASVMGSKTFRIYPLSLTIDLAGNVAVSLGTSLDLTVNSFDGTPSNDVRPDSSAYFLCQIFAARGKIWTAEFYPNPLYQRLRRSRGQDFFGGSEADIKRYGFKDKDDSNSYIQQDHLKPVLNAYNLDGTKVEGPILCEGEEIRPEGYFGTNYSNSSYCTMFNIIDQYLVKLVFFDELWQIFVYDLKSSTGKISSPAPYFENLNPPAFGVPRTPWRLVQSVPFEYHSFYSSGFGFPPTVGFDLTNFENGKPETLLFNLGSSQLYVNWNIKNPGPLTLQNVSSGGIPVKISRNFGFNHRNKSDRFDGRGQNIILKSSIDFNLTVRRTDNFMKYEELSTIQSDGTSQSDAPINLVFLDCHNPPEQLYNNNFQFQFNFEGRTYRLHRILRQREGIKSRLIQTAWEQL